MVQTQTPVNRFPDFVRYAIQQIKLFCPTLGKAKIADKLARAGIHIGKTTVGRILDEFKGKAKKPEAIERAEQIFKLIAADNDLKVSLKEFTNKPPEARCKQLDRNDDGKITFEEFKGKREEPEEIEEAEQRFKRIDKDGDKKLTLEEFKAAQKKRQPKTPAKKKFQPEEVMAITTT